MPTTPQATVEAHGIDALFVTVPDLLNEIRSIYGASSTPRMPYADDQDSLPGMSARMLQQAVRETTVLILAYELLLASGPLQAVLL